MVMKQHRPRAEQQELKDIKRLSGIVLEQRVDEGIDPLVQQKVQYQKQVVVSSIDFTADDWQLYTVSFPQDEIEKAAKYINSMLVGILNSAHNRMQASRASDKFIAPKFDKYGYSDTEPQQLLNEVFDLIYGEG